MKGLENFDMFGRPAYVASSEYQARDPSNQESRVEEWKQLDMSSIHSIYAALEKESLDTFRTSLRSLQDKNKLYAFVKKYFLKRCLEVHRAGVLKFNEEKKVLCGNSAAVCHCIGLRPLMEDTHVWGKVLLQDRTVPFFAICDGHAGDGAALFLKDHLQELLEYVFSRSGRLDDLSIENALMMVGVVAEERLAEVRHSAQANLLHDLMQQVGLKYEALTSTQDEADFQALCSRMYEASKSMPYALGGSTLVCAVLIDSTLWVANVGDSRGIIVTPTKVHQITDDASLTKEHFRQGVEKRGGSVGPDTYGTLRTSGGCGINLARSIGETKEVGVSARAKVSRYRLIAEKTTLVLGCDGLFDVLSTMDVGALVQKCSLDSSLKLSRLLVKAAFANGSEDNISAMVVKLS